MIMSSLLDIVEQALSLPLLWPPLGQEWKKSASLVEVLPPPPDHPPPRCSLLGPEICWLDLTGEVLRFQALLTPREGEWSCYPSQHQLNSARTGIEKYFKTHFIIFLAQLEKYLSWIIWVLQLVPTNSKYFTKIVKFLSISNAHKQQPGPTDLYPCVRLVMTQ